MRQRQNIGREPERSVVREGIEQRVVTDGVVADDETSSRMVPDRGYELAVQVAEQFLTPAVVSAGH